MKFRITPLNFATAAFLFLSAYTFIKGVSVVGSKTIHLGTAMGLVFLLFAFVVSFMDVMLRNFFPQTKKLWVIELSFITLAAIIFLIVK
ncbi:MAG: hypothetical protein ACXVJE_16365 [Mucilaginibacter sp.]